MDTQLKPHAVMVPFPETGHINPLMQLAIYLASHEFVITFVNTHHNHMRILEFNRSQLPSDRGLDIRLIGISDGLPQDDNRENDVPNFVKVVENIGPLLEPLIEKINQEGPVVTCIISDVSAVKTLDVAKKFGIPRVAFWPPTVASYAAICHATEGVRKQTFPATGIPESDETICFPGLPPMLGSEIGWMVGTKDDCESIFLSCTGFVEALRESEWVLCNSVYELEAQTLELLPQGFKRMCLIGPMLPSYFLERKCPRENGITTSLFPEEYESLDWLERQASASVLYVSLGSITILDKQQFEEFAYGLEASEVPLLWVLPKRLTGEKRVALPEGFVARMGERLKIVSWAPQLSVLAHGAIGGFLTHCGWNSTIESMSMGVPMLAWPQQVDQHMNAKLLVDKWGIAMALNKGEKGFLGRKRVEEQVTILMGDINEKGKEVRAKALKMRETILEATREGGSSYNSLHKFLNWAKQNNQALPCKHT